MKVNIVRTAGFPEKKLQQVAGLLRDFPGPILFVPREEPIRISAEHIARREMEQYDFETKQRLSQERLSALPGFDPATTTVADPQPPSPWQIVEKSQPRMEVIVEDQYLGSRQLVEYGQSYREQYQLAEEEMLIILSHLNNDLNWFYDLDVTYQNNAFIHAGYWDHFGFQEDVYPIVYLCATIPLIKQTFLSYVDWYSHLSDKPLGCPLDRCTRKTEITLKMRTADLSRRFLDLLEANDVPLGQIDQIISILDALRPHMLARKHLTDQPRKLKDLVVTNDFRKDIYYDGRRIPLTPMQKTVYLTFLNHPEGLSKTGLLSIRDEITVLYKSLTRQSETVAIKRSIDQLVRVRSNALSEHISRIKRALTKVIPPSVLKYYTIGSCGKNTNTKKIRYAEQYQQSRQDPFDSSQHYHSNRFYFNCGGLPPGA